MRFYLAFITLIFMASSPAMAGYNHKKDTSFENEMVKFNYSQLVDKSEKDKKIKSYVGYLNKNGVNDLVTFEQYKVRRRVHSMQKFQPRRWSETGHSDQRAADPYSN